MIIKETTWKTVFLIGEELKTMSEFSNDFWKLDFPFTCYQNIGIKSSS